jgi:hypothetical protein
MTLDPQRRKFAVGQAQLSYRLPSTDRRPPAPERREPRYTVLATKVAPQAGLATDAWLH